MMPDGIACVLTSSSAAAGVPSAKSRYSRATCLQGARMTIDASTRGKAYLAITAEKLTTYRLAWIRLNKVLISSGGQQGLTERLVQIPHVSANRPFLPRSSQHEDIFADTLDRGRA
jgi:hypothetical protein